jgi:chromate reductase
METKFEIAVLVGSLRADSVSRKVAGALAALAPESLDLRIVEIGDLPMYNPDADARNPPDSWIEFRQRLRSADGVLFVTPEYNRSVPAVLKNAVDIGSRPYGQSAWNGTPAAIVSTSAGAMGGFGANHHLRQSLVFLNMPTMPQPEAYIGNAEALFDADGRLTDERARGFLRDFIDAFADWVASRGAVADIAS